MAYVIEKQLNVNSEYTDVIAETACVTAKEVSATAEYTDVIAETACVTAKEVPATAEYIDVIAETACVTAKEVPATAGYTDVIAEYWAVKCKMVYVADILLQLKYVKPLQGGAYIITEEVCALAYTPCFFGLMLRLLELTAWATIRVAVCCH